MDSHTLANLLLCCITTNLSSGLRVPRMTCHILNDKFLNTQTTLRTPLKIKIRIKDIAVNEADKIYKT